VAVLFLVHWAADVGWLTGLGWLTGSGRSLISPGVYRWILIICGAALVFFGISFIIAGLTFLTTGRVGLG
jgi:threonine/homoserine/homoserine lactone efflux protein